MSRKFLLFGGIALACLLSACFSHSRQAEFFRLGGAVDSRAPVLETKGSTPGKLIGLGPVEIPAYLDRPQIVTGGPGNQLYLDEFRRWAEPLRDSVTQVLAEDLSAQLPGNHVLPFPWNRALAPETVVEIGISRFHVGMDGKSELRAQWQVLRRGKPALIKQSRIVEEAAIGDYAKMVAAQNRSLATLSREIAQALIPIIADEAVRAP